MQMGGPDSLEAVQPFLRNLFADPDILQLPRPMRPFQPLLARFISARRTPGAREAYASIGGRSPLLPITAQQADALERELLVRGVDAKTYVAMRYWGPRAPEVLNSAARDGVSTLVALPLYPHYSISTSASSIRDLQRALLARSSSASPFRTSLLLPTWQARPGYVAAVARGVARELVACPPDTHVLFSAHGVPEKYVQALGDPYLAEMRECVAAVMRKVRSLAPERAEAPHTLCFQSRVGPVRWLQPYTDATIRELGRRGTRSVLAVPIAFVSEHIETLEEMDGEYAELARRSGVQHWARVAALNDDAGMIADLACAVEEALRGEARSAQDLHAECADEKGDGVASAPELQEEAAAPLVLSDRVHGVPLESAGAARILSSVARVCAQEMERSKGWWSRARIMMS